MSDESGKWLPYNKDGSSHDCRTNGKAKQQEQAQAPAKQNDQQQQQQQLEQQEERPITIEQLNIWLARLEKAGVHIDINEILNPQKDQNEK